MKITIAGGGNIGTQFAVHCAEKGHEVIVYTSCPDLYDGHLNIVNEEGITTHQGEIKLATYDPEKAFSSSEMILITMPATMMKKMADVIYKYVGTGTLIGVVPGNGGAECAFRKCIEKGNTFFGIERVPAIARLVKKGKTVKSTGYREELHVASLPKSEAARCSAIIEAVFDIRTTVIPNYMNLTMTPSNPILHTTRLKRLFGDWHEGKTYKSVPLFYEEWDDASSELLIACDEEVQAICRALPDFELDYVKSLRVHYESPTKEAMTKKISSIPSFKGLTTPVTVTDKGLIPDLHSRYFTADFSYGLTIIKQVAAFAGVSTPYINDVMNWYKDISVEKDEFQFSDYGINSLEDLEQYYLQ